MNDGDDALVTELRDANARLRRALELRADVKAVSGHELRVPLTNLMGALDTLVEKWDVLDEGQRRQLVEMSQRAAHRVTAVAEALGRMAQAGNEALGAEPCDVALRPLLVDLLDTLGIEGVGLDCPEGVLAYATPTHIGQIVTNLVINAARHGIPPIAVRARAMEAAVTIAVEDAGPGLDPALGETVWEPSVGSAADSPGLGLAIVRALVEANGGSVRYQPDPDVRSRFVVTLPAAEHVS